MFTSTYIQVFSVHISIIFMIQMKKKVAVKVFLQETDIDNFSIAELLERAKHTRHLLPAYKYVYVLRPITV